MTGGQRVGDRGYFVAPTLLVDTRPQMKVVQEELFGPVVAAIPFSRENEVLPAVNDTVYGFASAVWARDVGRAQRIARPLLEQRAVTPASLLPQAFVPVPSFRTSLGPSRPHCSLRYSDHDTG